jgi:hypothetical protein
VVLTSTIKSIAFQVRKRPRMPGAGKLVTDMADGDPTWVDPASFRLTRFTNDSNPRPHPLAS